MSKLEKAWSEINNGIKYHLIDDYTNKIIQYYICFKCLYLISKRMGAQTTQIEKPVSESYDMGRQKQQDNNLNLHERQPRKEDYRFERKGSRIIPQLQRFKQQQEKKYNCTQRILLIQQKIHKIDPQFQNDNNFQNNLLDITKTYLSNHIFPLIQKHQQICFKCTGRYWQIQQWNYRKEQEIKVQQEPNKYKLLQFKIEEPDRTGQLSVIIYKYLQSGDGYVQKDKVRNMKIYKFPLSQLQLTNLILQHQYLVVQCQNSYWSFEKDSKRLIVQSSVLLSDVRDKCLGKNRAKQMGFKWFGLRQNWHPQVMYESNSFIIEDIKEVRVFAQHLSQISLKYNVFKANCKVYAQYIMKNCLTQQSWKSIQTFFDFFHK